ncbi:unnamed protein product [Caenorhabditis sp. 36 PRJEB53466]|nr:unnamed protein product [Caenorhabditis sp. 36 PRJEB53466]
MSAFSQSGIKFHRGTRTLEINKQLINNSIEFPDGFKFGLKEKHRYFKQFIEDVTRFNEKVSESTEPIYSKATTRIAKWLLEDTESGATATSVFSPHESAGTIRTALVQCNFTDIGRHIRDLKLKILELEEKRKGVTVILVTENDAIHSIIDRIASAKSGLSIVLIRQFESLRPQFLDSLISLIFSTQSTRHVVARLRFVVCVSTSPSFFTQTCATNTLTLLQLQQFKFTRLDDVFEKIVATGIHAGFRPPIPKSKSIEDDDPNRLYSFDCAPAVFSGPFLKYLKDRFFGCDFSVSALEKAIQFALLQKYLEDATWREDVHEAELQKYDVVFEAFKREFWEGDAISLHIQLQSEPNFWKEFKESTIFQQRKQFLFDTNSRTNLVEFAQKLCDDFAEIDENWCTTLEDLMRKLGETRLLAPPTPTQSKPTVGRMSMAEWQKQSKAAIEAKQNDPIRAAKSAVYAHVMRMFESTLKPYPSTWRNVVGAPFWTNGEVKVSLDSSDEFDIEKCLLEGPADPNHPISVAWRALLSHRSFKIVPMTEWAAEFLKHVKMSMSKKEAKNAFFAAAGQLEHIGLIRGSADRQSANVNVLYHPLSVIPHI